MELGVTCVGFLNDVEVAVDKERGKGSLKKSTQLWSCFSGVAYSVHIYKQKT